MHKAIVISVLAAACSAGVAQTAVPYSTLQKFQDSLGINDHINYTDGLYANEPQILKDLQYLGINNVRDGIPATTWPAQGYSDLLALAAAGVKFDLVVDPNSSVPYQLAHLDLIEQATPGAISTVEGPNEIDNFPLTNLPSGVSQQEGAYQVQEQLYQYVQEDSLLSDVKVLYMTGAAQQSSLTGLADYGNTHPYPYNESQPFARLVSDQPVYFAGSALSAPMFITETGYSTIPTAQSGVDEVGQGEMGLNIYFDALLEGVPRTYVYQLLEAYPNQTTDGDTAYGLFHYTDGSPKIEAQLLHNIALAYPADKGNTLPNPGVTIASGSETPLPSTVHSIALNESNGNVLVYVWNEQPVWNSTTDTSSVAPQIVVQLAIPGTWKTQAFWPLSTDKYPWAQYSGTVGGKETAQLPVFSFPTAIEFVK